MVSLSILDALACVVGFVQLVVEVSFFGGDIEQGTLDPPAIASNTLYYIYMMFMCSSASVVITIAVIRNLFVLKPMKARGWFTAGSTKVICFVNFLVTLVLFAPVSLKIISQSCEKEVNVSVCDWMDSTDPSLNRVGQVYAHYFLSALYGPVLIIVYIICFICIRFTVGKSVQRLNLITPRTSAIPGTPKGRHSALSDEARIRSRTAKRITKTLLVILILDVVCTLPYVVQGIGLLVAEGQGVFDEGSHAGMVYDVIVEIFLNLRPSYNFWLYIYQHPEFRVRVKSIVHRMFSPCFKSEKYCTCCKSDSMTNKNMKTPKNWSSSSPHQERSPWFKQVSFSPQNGKNNMHVTTHMADDIHAEEHSHSMDSSETNTF